MKLTIIGGSQGTGFQLAIAARDAGHEVTVLSRSGKAPSGVRGLAGSATDGPSVRTAVTGADAVAVTVSGAKGVHHQRAAITRTVVDAMRAEDVRRLLVQSSLGAGDSGSQLPGALGLLTRVALAKPLADHNEQEAAVRDSGLDWTIVRPTGLGDKLPTGRWQSLEVGDPGKLSRSIPRSDLAAAMLGFLTDDATIGKAIGVSG